MKTFCNKCLVNRWNLFFLHKWNLVRKCYWLFFHKQIASFYSDTSPDPHQFSSLAQLWLFVTPWTVAHQASLSITNSWSLLKFTTWCHPTISSSAVPFSSCSQSFPASGSFPMSQLSASGGQIIGISASASVLPMNTQDRSPLGWTGWIPLQSKGLSRVFSNTTVQKHQFFGVQLSLWSNSHIPTRLLEKP